MKNLLVVIAIVLVTGCAPTGVKFQTPLKNIGIIVNTDSNNLCYGRQKFFIGEPDIRSYTFSNSLQDTIKVELEAALAKKGITSVQIDPFDISPSGYFESYSTWDSSGKINPEYINAFIKQTNRHNVDAVLVFSLDTSRVDEDICTGIAIIDSSQYGLGLRVPPITIYSAQGEFSQHMYLGSKISGAALAHQPRILSQSYVDRIERTIVDTLHAEVNKKVNPGIR